MILVCFGSHAFAGGKKSPPVGESCNASVVQPARPVRVLSVGTLPFQLPNGERVEISQDLKTIFETTLLTHSSLRPAEFALDDPCAQWLEIRAAVTSLDLDVTEFGVRFGYTPQGAIPTVDSITGEARVKLGSLTMDLGLRLCTRNGCQVVVASSADQTLAELKVDVKVDFSLVTTGASFMTRTPMGAAFRTVFEKAVTRLEKASQLASLPWRAQVVTVDHGSGQFWINAGREQRLPVGMALDVFAPSPQGPACSVSQRVARAQVRTLTAVSSEAEILETYDRSVRSGDVVMMGISTPASRP